MKILKDCKLTEWHDWKPVDWITVRVGKSMKLDTLNTTSRTLWACAPTFFDPLFASQIHDRRLSRENVRPPSRSGENEVEWLTSAKDQIDLCAANTGGAYHRNGLLRSGGHPLRTPASD